MVLELGIYGLMCGLLIEALKIRNQIAAIETVIVISLLCGRVISGLCNYLIFKTGPSTLGAWLIASFVTCLPGLALLLVLTPMLVLLLRKTHAIS